MNHLRTSRRSFLKATLAAGVSPLILPSGIWSAETKPNDRIALGFIGMGKMNSGHLGGFLGRKDTHVVAVCDVDTTRREHAKKKVEERYSKDKGAEYKGCAAYNDFRELVERKDIDAVVIATPDHWHALTAIAALNAGKDVYCEKPLTNTIHEAWALVDAVRKNNRVLQVGSQQRSSREFWTACMLVRNGVIGKVSKVLSGFGGPGRPCDLGEEPMEPGLDWDMWLGPAPKRPYHSELSPRGLHNHFPNWRRYLEYGGGMVTDWGAHHLDIAHWGIGADESGPLEIIPPENAKKAQEGCRLRYAGGVEVEHISSNGVTFLGEDGEIYVNRGKFTFTLKGEQKAGSAKGEELAKVESEFLKDAKVKLYRTESGDHKTDWINAIRARSKPICDVAIGASTVTGCHLINLAYNNAKTLKWDPAKRQFVDGTGDAKWLTREYRGPWKV